MRGPKIPLAVAVSLLVLALSYAVPNLPRFGLGTDSALAQVAPLAAPTLNLKLSTTLDNVPGTTKVTAITSAELLDKTGAVVSTATIASGTAKANLTGLATGDYFIRVNGLATDLVPTRIVTAGVSYNQFVGQRLRQSVIGALASPSFRIVTFSKGQGWKAVVAYTTGAVLTPARYAYSIQSLTTPKKIETRVLGRGALLSTRTNSGPHPWATWMIGPSNHGTNTSSCSGCHGNLASKPAAYGSISESNGWCYMCHYGKAGAVAGMVNRLK
jgi:hypothetical protein